MTGLPCHQRPKPDYLTRCLVANGGAYGPRLKALAKQAKKKHAAIAYVTDGAKVRLGIGDVLVTNASDEAINPVKRVRLCRRQLASVRQ